MFSLFKCLEYVTPLSCIKSSAGVNSSPQSDLVFSLGHPDHFFFKFQKYYLGMSCCGLVFTVVHWLLSFICLICKMRIMVTFFFFCYSRKWIWRPPKILYIKCFTFILVSVTLQSPLLLGTLKFRVFYGHLDLSWLYIWDKSKVDSLKSFVCILAMYKCMPTPCCKQVVCAHAWRTSDLKTVVLFEGISRRKHFLHYILLTLFSHLVSHIKLGLHDHGLRVEQYTGKKNFVFQIMRAENSSQFSSSNMFSWICCT